MTSERAPASGAPGADAWGITDGYQDAGGVWHETPGATRAAVLAAMRVQEGAPRTPRRVLVVRAGQPARVPGLAELRLEDGAVLRASRALPPDLPAGYHELRPLDGRPPLRLIASPGHCHVPPRRAWGWSAQLYATRSADSWGVGDLGDLERLAR